jgi:hypothetical protein
MIERGEGKQELFKTKYQVAVVFNVQWIIQPCIQIFF